VAIRLPASVARSFESSPLANAVFRNFYLGSIAAALGYTMQATISAWLMATWFQGPAAAFIDVSREGFERGVRILHFLGGSSIDVEATRAIAQTKMTISQRGDVDGVRCDVVCTGRFYDFFEQREDRWKIMLRQPIYEKDRLDPLDPSATPKLDPALLMQFPEGYRHLAYLQARLGYDVKRDMPGLTGAEVERLYADGAAWLAGRPLAR
jgi:hypothetical protein